MPTISELSNELKNGTSAIDLAETYLQRAKELNKITNAFITIDESYTRAQAEAASARLKSGTNVTPLTGVPIALKDALVTKDLKTTAGSKMLATHVPVYNGHVVQKLIDQGAVILGKLNMDEFAMGSSNENSFFGPVKNPWNPEYVPGGSSGGSAAAVAADMCVASLGSDTGGSIRQPAAYTGIVGIKPTYGRVSRYGLIAFASSLDQIGPMTKTVTDSALMLNAISSYDDFDSTSLNIPTPDFTKALVNDVRGLKIGIPREYFEDGIDEEILNAVTTAKETLEKLGATLVDIELPHTSFAVPCYYIIAPAEASSNLARYDGVRFGFRADDVTDIKELYIRSRSEGFGEEVKRRIIIGTYALSSGYYDAYYKRAQCVRSLIKKDFTEAFNKVDLVLTPTTPDPAFKIGERGSDPVKMYLNDIFTVTANLAGLPAMSLPCGFTKSKLPIGLQLIGKPLDEETILKVAYTYEQNTNWHQQRAPKL